MKSELHIVLLCERKSNILIPKSLAAKQLCTEKMEKKRNTEGLYHLIKSLSHKERRLVKDYISANSKGKDKTKYEVLLAQFISLRSFDTKALIPDPFPNQRSLRDCSVYLIPKVLEQLAVVESGPWYDLAIIEKAIDKGFFSIAGSLIGKEKVKITQSTRLDYKLEAFRIQKKLQKYSPSTYLVHKFFNNELKFLRESSALMKTKYFSEMFRTAFLLPHEERMEIYAHYEQQVDRLYDSQFHHRARSKVLRMRTTWHVLGKDLEGARKSHDAVFRIMENHPEDFSTDEHTDETLFQVVLLAHFGEFEKAELMAYRLGALEGENEMQSQRILHSWIYAALLVAASSGNIPLGKRASTELQKYSNQIGEERLSLLLHFASITFIYAERWEKVLELQTQLSELPVFRNEGVKRFSPAIKALCHFEMGDYASARSEMDNFQAETAPLESRYYQAIVDAFSILLNDEIGVRKKFAPIKKVLNDLEAVLEDPQESQFADAFDFTGWLRATLEGNKLIDLVLSKRSSPLLRFRFNA